MMPDQWPIDAIRVGARARSDLGDVDALAESIRRVGLMNPITVTREGQLVAGGRRLAACRSLGWPTVPVMVANELGDALAQLQAEVDENVQRKSMTPSERVHLGRQLEEVARREAAERKGATQAKPGVGKVGGENFSPPTARGKTDEVVGRAVGMSAITYQRAKAVVVVAEAGKPGGREALERMDATGKVNGSYNQIREHAPGRVAGKGVRGHTQSWQPRQVKSPAVIAGERAVADRAALKLVTAAANAALKVERDRERVLDAVPRIALGQDVERYALHVGWAVSYLQRVEVALRGRLTAQQREDVDAALRSSGHKSGAELRLVGGKR